MEGVGECKPLNEKLGKFHFSEWLSQFFRNCKRAFVCLILPNKWFDFMIAIISNSTSNCCLPFEIIPMRVELLNTTRTVMVV